MGGGVLCRQQLPPVDVRWSTEVSEAAELWFQMMSQDYKSDTRYFEKNMSSFIYIKQTETCWVVRKSILPHFHIACAHNKVDWRRREYREERRCVSFCSSYNTSADGEQRASLLSGSPFTVSEAHTHGTFNLFRFLCGSGCISGL